MTIQEFGEQARRIWGEQRFIGARLRADGGADVSLLQAGRASDMRGRNFSAHRLDRDGHPTCHNDCETLEGT